MNALTGPFVRTTRRFQRLFETIREEYWRTHKTFSRHGCSLLPADISMRSCKVATFMATFIMIVTLPPIFYYRGFMDVEHYLGLGSIFIVSWIMFYLFVWIAHILWASTYMVGSKFGGSRYFWGIIEKRWTAKIDRITEEFLKGDRQEAQEVLEGIKEENEEKEGEGDENKKDEKDVPNENNNCMTNST